MSTPLYIGGLTFLLVLVLIYVLTWAGRRLIKKYRSYFTETASSNLGDLFIFSVTPDQLYLWNLAVLVVSFLFIWIWTAKWILALLFSLCLAAMPQAVYGILKKRRNSQFLGQLPDTLNSLASMLQAGTNLSSALEIVVAESKPPISQEFGLVLKEVRLGVDISEALENMAQRMPLEEVNMVVAGMKISREVGGSLSDVLKRLSETIRSKLELEGKIESLTAMGKAQGYVMALLPFLLGYVLYKMEPQSMSLLFDSVYGWGVCALIVVLEVLGFWFIKKIVTIDV